MAVKPVVIPLASGVYPVDSRFHWNDKRGGSDDFSMLTIINGLYAAMALPMATIKEMYYCPQPHSGPELKIFVVLQ